MAYSRAFSDESTREILVSLPVKSLLRFKCVCKNWGSLINNPSFTIDHCKKKKPQQHLIYDYGAADDAPTVTLVSDKGMDEQKIFQRFARDSITNLLGSIDGVFFIERDIDNAILCTLWNPANREVRHLPAAPIDFVSFDARYRHLVFGLDPMTKDYKVIYFNQIGEYAALYSCFRDSWKIFKHNVDAHVDEYYFVYNQVQTTDYLNGYYYWMLTENTKCKIISFDFGNEVFVEMEGPPGGHDDYSDKANLIFLGDCLGILKFGYGCVTDVWIMIQPGVWNKHLTIPISTCIKSCYDNSMILVTISSRLVSYNVRTNKTKLFEFRHLGLHFYPECGGCGVYYYKESLVTIKRHGNSDLHLNRCMTKRWSKPQI